MSIKQRGPAENGGQSWRATQLPDVPDLAVIVDVAASLHDASSFYAVAHNFQRGDFRPYVFRSTDRGRTWTPIATNSPERHVTWSLAEDHVNPDLLFLGTEYALFFTLNGGAQWTRLSGGVPTIMFRHLEIQRRENDLVAGTFGRGIYILDDYAPLRALTPALRRLQTGQVSQCRASRSRCAANFCLENRSAEWGRFAALRSRAPSPGASRGFVAAQPGPTCRRHCTSPSDRPQCARRCSAGLIPPWSPHPAPLPR